MKKPISLLMVLVALLGGFGGFLLHKGGQGPGKARGLSTPLDDSQEPPRVLTSRSDALAGVKIRLWEEITALRKQFEALDRDEGTPKKIPVPERREFETKEPKALPVREAVSEKAMPQRKEIGESAPAPTQDPRRALPVRRAIFENATPQQEKIGEKVIAATRDRFNQLMKTEAGQRPIRVCFVDRCSWGEASRTVSVNIQGITSFQDQEWRIEISREHTASFERILAHEVAHALVREAFGIPPGVLVNRTLNEGLAEYLASLECAGEVNRDFQSGVGQSLIPPKWRPYMDGYRFCRRHAEEPGFGTFFARHLGDIGGEYAYLDALWSRQTLACAR